jgi:ribonuclease HI
MKKLIYYAVHIGHQIGVFTSWPQCEKSVSGYPKTVYLKFDKRKDAEYFVKHGERPCSKPKASKGNGKKLAIIYTDGSASGGVMSDIGSGLIVYLEGITHKAYYGLYDCVGTNNIAELNALAAGLKEASKLITEGYYVEVLTDSNYALKCATQWSYKWKQHCWKKSDNKTPENLALIKECHLLYDTLKDFLTLMHVKAHNGIEGNEAADVLADMAVSNKQELLIEIPVSEVIKPT